MRCETIGTMHGQSAIRAFFLEPTLNELQRLHQPIGATLGRHGLTSSDIASPYAWVPLRCHTELLEDAAEQTNNPYLGFDIGRRFDQRSLGPFCALLANAGTLREVFELYGGFQGLWQINTRFLIERHEDVTHYTYVIDDPSIWPRRQDAELTLAALVTLGRQAGFAHWSPETVEFEHVLPADKRPLRAFFDAPVFGSCDANRLVVANSDLERPLGHGAGGGAKVLERHLVDLMRQDNGASETTGIVEATVAIINRRMGRAPLDIATVALEMHTSERSLRRHLEEAGTSFRDLVQQQRLLRARSLLRGGHMPLIEAAARLGYADAAAFCRAFRGWTGMSPMRFAQAGH
ncbi:HTH-type transcriptional regulator GadW [Devosia equisanguinis]|uniref:HTH-type transcriptional regulator GadW n=1 Tax=Devosia equisanguinis TaxID=2490941 RepID=A0A447IE13_9HYPH|nr:AraC family transcriptional regulator [Devosia equisanguinis]VDS05715.1 HTH-type transcriptional regulator GadW [Devosia equisanguinis]